MTTFSYDKTHFWVRVESYTKKEEKKKNKQKDEEHEKIKWGHFYDKLWNS